MGYQLQPYQVILGKINNLEKSYNEHRAAAKAQKGFFRNVGSVGENKSRAQTIEALNEFKNHIELLRKAIEEDKHKNLSDTTVAKYSKLLHAAPALFLAQIYASYKIDLFENKLVLPKEAGADSLHSTVSNSGMARALCEILGIEKFGDLSSSFSDHLKQLKEFLAKPGMGHIKQKMDVGDIDNIIDAISEHFEPKTQASVVSTI